MLPKNARLRPKSETLPTQEITLYVTVFCVLVPVAIDNKNTILELITYLESITFLDSITFLESSTFLEPITFLEPSPKSASTFNMAKSTLE